MFPKVTIKTRVTNVFHLVFFWLEWLLNTVLRKFGFHDWLLMVPSLSVDHIQGVRVIKNNDILNLYIGICHTKWLRGRLVSI